MRFPGGETLQITRGIRSCDRPGPLVAACPGNVRGSGVLGPTRALSLPDVLPQLFPHSISSASPGHGSHQHRTSAPKLGIRRHCGDPCERRSSGAGGRTVMLPSVSAAATSFRWRRYKLPVALLQSFSGAATIVGATIARRCHPAALLQSSVGGATIAQRRCCEQRPEVQQTPASVAPGSLRRCSERQRDLLSMASAVPTNWRRRAAARLPSCSMPATGSSRCLCFRHR
jgi:hypothetical protein